MTDGELEEMGNAIKGWAVRAAARVVFAIVVCVILVRAWGVRWIRR